VMDVHDVEQVDIRALGGADVVTVGDLTGTDLTTVNLALNLPSYGDYQADSVVVAGTGANDSIQLSGGKTSLNVTGLSAAVHLLSPEGSKDELTILAGAGDDVVNASQLGAGIVKLTLNGGVGIDTLLGSAGAATIVGGKGDDTAPVGGGEDVFGWNPGEGGDNVEGEAGYDTLQFNGADQPENVDISANGSRIRFFRDIATINMNVNGTEQINFLALGGADNIVVHDLNGTDVKKVNIDLRGTTKGGDAAADTVTVNGSTGNDNLAVTGIPTGVNFRGLKFAVNVLNTEAVNDKLIVNGGAGNDRIDATGLKAGVIQLELHGEEGNDVLIGSAGDDLLDGGPG